MSTVRPPPAPPGGLSLLQLVARRLLQLDRAAGLAAAVEAAKGDDFEMPNLKPGWAGAGHKFGVRQLSDGGASKLGCLGEPVLPASLCIDAHPMNLQHLLFFVAFASCTNRAYPQPPCGRWFL